MDINLLVCVSPNINANIGRSEGRSSWETIFLNGKSYPVDNQDAGGFQIYINYDDELFSYYSLDQNMPRMRGYSGMAHNTWLFCKIGPDVFMSYLSTKCDELMDKDSLVRLSPLDDIVRNEVSEVKNTNDSIKSKKDEESFIHDFRKSFFEIVKSEN